MLEKQSLKKAQRKMELSQDWELLNDVEEDLALSRLEQVEIKKLKQMQLNEGWREQIEARSPQGTGETASWPPCRRHRLYISSHE